MPGQEVRILLSSGAVFQNSFKLRSSILEGLFGGSRGVGERLNEGKSIVKVI